MNYFIPYTFCKQLVDSIYFLLELIKNTNTNKIIFNLVYYKLPFHYIRYNKLFKTNKQII